MQYILASNTIEHPGFSSFLQDAGKAYPHADFLYTGDFLNIFPEPGEYLEGSIYYEIFGEMILSEMETLVAEQFRNVSTSRFLEPLREMFYPMGKHVKQAEALALQRYQRVFSSFARALGSRTLSFIPGNMDYPTLCQVLTHDLASLRMLDTTVFEQEGLRIAGIGGIPNTVHPFRGIAEISPYEMTEAEYQRRLQRLIGADVLLTHISPQEFPPLQDFLLESPLRLLICRAPFDFRRQGDFRGKLEVDFLAQGKAVIRVRPFDFPRNRAFVLSLHQSLPFTEESIEIYEWSSSLSEGGRSD